MQSQCVLDDFLRFRFSLFRLLVDGASNGSNGAKLAVAVAAAAVFRLIAQRLGH